MSNACTEPSSVARVDQAVSDHDRAIDEEQPVDVPKHTGATARRWALALTPVRSSPPRYMLTGATVVVGAGIAVGEPRGCQAQPRVGSCPGD